MCDEGTSRNSLLSISSQFMKQAIGDCTSASTETKLKTSKTILDKTILGTKQYLTKVQANHLLLLAQLVILSQFSDCRRGNFVNYKKLKKYK